MLEVVELRAGYNGSDAIRSVSLSVQQGQVVTVLGPNGAGKSTLINSICGLTQVHAGAIQFEGVDITRLPAPDIVDMGIVQVPEGRQLFGSLSVDENLRLGFHRLRRSTNRAALFKERLAYVYDLFPKLRERSGQRAVTLSGGEQSMVAMGRALMAAPKVLLLDEPSIGLAPLIVERLFDVLAKLRDSGLTLLLVEQHAEKSLRLAHYGYVMNTGVITAQSQAADLLNSPSLCQSYLGGSPPMSAVGNVSSG